MFQIPCKVGLLPLFDNPNACVRRYVFSEHNWHDYEAYGRSVRSNGFLYLINKRPHLPWQGAADSVRSASHITLLKKRNKENSPAQQDVFLVPRPAIELYDVHNDPHQLNNLAGSASTPALKRNCLGYCNSGSKRQAIPFQKNSLLTHLIE